MSFQFATRNRFACEQSARLAGLWRLTLLTLLPILLWDLSGWDLLVMQHLADGRGFALRHHPWLEHGLHDAARQVALWLYLVLWAMVWWPQGPLRTISRSQRAQVVLGMALGLLLVNWLKQQSATSCPWDLQAFGGHAQYLSHWRWGVGDGGPGHCFPGGHASAGFAFVALALPWLGMSDAAPRRRGMRLLGWVLMLGVMLGVTQTLRGAHYISHTLWSAWLCWLAALLNHHAFVVWAHRRAQTLALA